MKNKEKIKVALVYDRVNTPFGGAEKVLLALHELYPNAPLYTSVYDPEKAKWANAFQIRTSFLQKFPFVKNHHRLFAWLMPLAFETLDLSGYDIIISVTSAEAKGIITRADQLHICYLLTPTRYLYSHKEHYKFSIFKVPIFNYLSTLLLYYLKNWDQVAAQRPDYIIPISKLVAKRTKKYYGRETEKVIYPTITSNSKFQTTNSKQITNPNDQNNYYLVLSRLVSYKRIDLAIKACQELGRDLIIVGNGPEDKNLQKLVTRNSLLDARIRFIKSTSKYDVQVLFKSCIALIMPGIEDFGITALEANALGKPVILHKDSGVAELIKDSKQGTYIENETIESVKKAILSLESNEQLSSRTSTTLSVNLYSLDSKYDTKYFLEQFSSTIKRLYANFQKTN